MNPNVVENSNPEAMLLTHMISPIIGAEVTGLSLNDPLSASQIAQLRKHLNKHHVLFFRNQDISIESQIRFARCFGDLHIHPAAGGFDGHPEVFELRTDADSTYVVGDSFHADVTCDVQPPLGSVLRLVQVPAVGGDTLFVNMHAAFAALSDRMQSFLSSLSAVHESEHLYRGRYGSRHRLRDDDYPHAIHPVVRTHPETGSQCLFVNSAFTRSICDMKPREGEALLQFLFEHTRLPEFQCRFQWQENSIAFWDNRSTQHYALWDYYPEVRHGYRVTIQGDKPFYRAATI